MKAIKKENRDSFSQKIKEKEELKINAIHEQKRSEWFGLGMFGMIGWSVAVPTLLGTASGIWLDHHYPQSFSWTLTCLISGLALGCVIAWNWVSKENKAMHKKDKNE